MPYSIIYRSKAKDSFTTSQIEIMLIKAKQFNKNHNITGCIVYNADEFIQIIEGDKSEISQLYSKIKNDDRHHDVTTLIETESDTMLWDKWSMAFYKFSNDTTSNNHNRLLLESYFSKVGGHQRASQVFTVLRDNILDLLNDI